MKKLLAVLIVLAMMFSFADCGSSDGSAQQSSEQETETPSQDQSQLNSREKNVGGIYSLTIPDEWERDDTMQAWINPEGNVAVYLYTMARSYGNAKMSDGLSVEDSNFEEEYVKYLQDIYANDGYTIKSSIGYNLMTASKVIYYQGMIMYTDSSRNTSSSLVNVFDYIDDEFFVIEYAYSPLQAQSAIDCSKQINDTIKKLK